MSDKLAGRVYEDYKTCPGTLLCRSKLKWLLRRIHSFGATLAGLTLRVCHAFLAREGLGTDDLPRKEMEGMEFVNLTA